MRVRARSMRTGGTRVGNRCYIQAGTQISPSSRVARRLCCEDPGTCLHREACGHYTEPVPVAARGGELGAPGSCADHRTCSHVRNCRYEDEGVSMGRARERAVCACAPKLRARERIERASIIFSGGALVLAVERASSLSRAEAASHGPSVMACRDPAPAQTPRYREERAHTQCMPLQIRATLRAWDSVARYQLYISGPVCVNPDGASVLRFCTRVQLTGRMHALYEWV